MIPKVIHYCWFGGNPLDKRAISCIKSWKKYFPDYEIIEWNEDNFDISAISFMEKAYLNKKWAFVSDVARLLIIYNYGGIYFDTDVEVISDYSDIIKNGNFWGYEQTKYVASGLGFGMEKNNKFVAKLLDYYRDIDFDDFADCLNEIACPIITTKLMMDEGLKMDNKLQFCCDSYIYPSEYFCPMDFETGQLKLSENTHSIHWYNNSWNNEKSKNELARERKLIHIFGEKMGGILFGIITNIEREGVWKYIVTRIRKKI